MTLNRQILITVVVKAHSHCKFEIDVHSLQANLQWVFNSINIFHVMSTVFVYYYPR